MIKNRSLFVVAVIFCVGLLFYFIGFKALFGLIALVGTKAFWLSITAWLATPLKLLLFSALKFIILGTGALVAPVLTTNGLVKMQKAGVMTFVDYLHSTGKIDKEHFVAYAEAYRPIGEVVTHEAHHLSRPEARQYLFGLIKETAKGIPGAFRKMCAKVSSFIQKKTQSEEV